MHDVERIYAIHGLLRRPGSGYSVEELERRLEVSPPTIKREIRFMRDRLRAPIEWTKERGYHYAQGADAFELPGFWFSQEELFSLLAAEQLLEAVQPGLLERQLAPLKNRIRQLLSRSGFDGATVGERIQLRSAPRRTVRDQAFDAVAAAVLNGRPIACRYHGRSSDRQTRRTLHPYRLLHYRDNWYLQAWCETAQELRLFSLDRIHEVTPLDGSLRAIPPDQLDNAFSESFGIFPGAPVAWAELRFTAERARWIADEIWHPDQQGEWRDGCYHLRIPYADPRELILEIMRYGPDVEVLAPPALREEVAIRQRAAARLYSGESAD